MTDCLEDFLDLGDEADVENRGSKFDVTEMTWTFKHILSAGTTAKRSVDSAEFRIVEALFTRPVTLLVHCLRVLNVANAHVLNLLRRQKSELDLLHRLQRSAGIRERVKVRHGEIEVGG